MKKVTKMPKTEEAWKKRLTPEQFRILRQCGTEPPFSGKWLYNKEKGVYKCAACGADLFSSDTKYESGTGWPSFWAAIEKNVELKKEKGLFGRVEVICKRCGGHLGHVFDDGPPPTGKRFCINSLALDFRKNFRKKKTNN